MQRTIKVTGRTGKPHKINQINTSTYQKYSFTDYMIYGHWGLSIRAYQGNLSNGHQNETNYFT